MDNSKKEKRDKVKSYIKQYDPYESAQPLGYDIRAVCRYAADKGCSVSDLSKEEVDRFRVS